MNAYIARFMGSRYKAGKKMLELEPAVPREENPKPQMCLKHPKPCVYDGLACPACDAESEFLRLTEDMKVR